MRLVLPSAEESPNVLRALKTIAMADGDLSDRERRMLEVAAELMGLSTPPEDVDVITADALAEGVIDPVMRDALMQRLVVMTLLDSRIHPLEIATLERFALSLGVNEDGVAALRRTVRDHLQLMAYVLGRRCFFEYDVGPGWNPDGLRALWDLAEVSEGSHDPALHARAGALHGMEAGTLGHAYGEFLSRSGIPLPGTTGGAQAGLVFHDVTHVLSGYDTSPEGEVNAFTFQAGYMGDDGLVLLLLVAMVFHVGLVDAPLTTGVSPLDLDAMKWAYLRGKALTQSLVRWDPWPHMARTLESVRVELNVPPIPEAGMS